MNITVDAVSPDRPCFDNGRQRDWRQIGIGVSEFDSAPIATVTGLGATMSPASMLLQAASAACGLLNRDDFAVLEL